MNVLPRSVALLDAGVQARRLALTWWASWAAFAAAAVVGGALAAEVAPRPFPLALAVLVAVAAVVLVRPHTGVHLVAFLTLVGDTQTSAWYPFTKNLSSQESILFVHDMLIVSPLELLLAVTAVGWCLRMLGDRRWSFRAGTLGWPVAAFTAFVLMGVAHGLGTGGDVNAGLWEARPMLYLPVAYVLVTNLCATRAAYRRLFGWAVAGIAVNALLSLHHYTLMSEYQRGVMEHLGEHGASLHLDVVFVLLAAGGLHRIERRSARVALGVLAVPAAVLYVLAQRRAAMVCLAIGLIVVAGVLFQVRRRAFWRIVPVVVVVIAAYTAAFWGSTSAAASPAQAIKTVVAPDQLSAKDQSSDAYRQIESVNILATIRSSPLLGIGFGHKFLQPIPLPDISFFFWWEYMTHNAVLWIWMKTGAGGFLAMLYLFARAIRDGFRTLVRLPSGTDAALALTSVAYVVMYAVYAYVDIAWDTRSMVLLAVALAAIATLDRLPLRPVAGVASSPPPPSPELRGPE